jgi:hypothetical protein
MLPGERTREYVTPDRDRRAVCDLCRAQAQRAGWVRADYTTAAPPTEEPEKPERPRRRLRRRGPGGPRRGASESPERRIRRALDRFNDSEHRRTVEGLTRSLGRPRVAAITPAESPQQVRLTVAWDLSWYQWMVDFSGREADVSSLRSGKDVRELGAADRAWNARASEDGRLQLGQRSNGDREARSSDESA